MSFDLFLFLLRIGIALALYAFLGALFYFLWRNLPAQTTKDLTYPPAFLHVLSGDDMAFTPGQHLKLKSVNLIGRGPTCTVILQETFASTEHARISWRNGHWWLEDLNSRNGTQLNEHPVEEGVIISTGDIIRIGRVQFQFESG